MKMDNFDKFEDAFRILVSCVRQDHPDAQVDVVIHAADGEQVVTNLPAVANRNTEKGDGYWQSIARSSSLTSDLLRTAKAG